MFERFATSTREAVRDGAEEASRRGDRRIGTDHLLLGLLHDPGTAGALGVSLDQARATAADLDRKALESIGIDLGGYVPNPGLRARFRTQSFTSGAREVMARTLALTTGEKARRIAPRHLGLALLERRQPDPAAALLAELGVDLTTAQQRLRAG